MFTSSREVSRMDRQQLLALLMVFLMVFSSVAYAAASLL